MASFLICILVLVIIVCAICVCCDKHGIEKTCLRAFAFSAFFTIVVCALVECTVFNYDAIAGSGLQPVELGGFSYEDEKENSVVFDGLSGESQTIELSFAGPDVATEVTAFIKDSSNSKRFVEADRMLVAPADADLSIGVLRLKSEGEVHAIRVEWQPAVTGDPLSSQKVRLVSARLNAPLVFRPSALRYLLIVAFMIILFAIKHFELWHICFNATNRTQKIAYAIMVVLFLVLPWVLNNCMKPKDTSPYPLTQSVAYPLEKKPSEMADQVHPIMFDTLFNGGTVRDDPPKELLALNNPYDYSERKVAGLLSLYWDYALCNGKLYVYFGMAPIFAVYIPYFLVFGRLPSYTTAALALAEVGVLAAFLCVWELARRFGGRVPAICVPICGAAVVAGSGLFLMQSCADRYYLTCLSSIAFFFMTVWLALLATRCRSRARRPAFALCGLSTFLLVWSRPSGAMAAFGWLLPLFLLVLASHEDNKRSKAMDAASYLVPLCLGMCAIMYFNYIRFNSPFEFGQFHQLTVEDTRKNAVSLACAPMALWYYLFDGVDLCVDFPWLRLTNTFVNHTGNFTYHSINIGALLIPVTWGVFVLSGEGFPVGRLPCPYARLLPCPLYA